MKIKGMSLGQLGTNCYIAYRGNKGLIIDPGSDAGKIKTFLEKEDIAPQGILLTHAHFDHIGAVEEIRSYFDIEVYLHETEARWLEDPSLNGSSLFTGGKIVASRADHFLKPGMMEIDSFAFEVAYTPGHSPGSVSFIFHDDAFVVSGDALFFQGIGRTDLPYGDYETLEKSIRKQLYKLDDAYIVYPGHGPATVVGNEKKTNPFVRV